MNDDVPSALKLDTELTIVAAKVLKQSYDTQMAPKLSY